jgi:hypothetical protein
VVGFVLGPAVTNALELHPMRHLGCSDRSPRRRC